MLCLNISVCVVQVCRLNHEFLLVLLMLIEVHYGVSGTICF